MVITDTATIIGEINGSSTLSETPSPAINSRGYYSKKNECFMHVDDATGDEAKWIKAYNILQYNSMFDEKDRSSLLFPYLK